MLTAERTSRILIIDDHPIIRQGMVALIDREASLQVCGHAGTVGEALAAVAEHQPDLLLIDVSLGDGNGLEVVKSVRDRYKQIKQLVVSVHDDTLYAERALQAGATGYVNKREATSKLIEAIRAVLNGEMYVSDRVLKRVLGRLGKGPIDIPSNPVECLSNRELQVYEMIGQGHTTQRIAAILGLSYKTIETHQANIKKKLGLRNALELTRSAVQWDLENR